MSLQTSGEIALSHLQTEFGGANPISLSEYYAGGSYTPSSASGTNGAVPSSGTLSMWNFYGTQASYGTPIALYAGVILGYGSSNTNVNRFTMAGAVYGTQTAVGLGGGDGMSLDGKGIGYGGGPPDYTVYNITREYNAAGATVGSDTNIGTARAHLGAASLSIGIAHSGLAVSTLTNKTTRITSSRAIYGSETALGTTASWCHGGGMRSREEGLFFTGTTGYRLRINTSGALVVTEAASGISDMRGGDSINDVLHTADRKDDWTMNYSRWNYAGTQIGSTVAVSSNPDHSADVKFGAVGSDSDDRVLFYGGNIYGELINKVLINSSGVAILNEHSMTVSNGSRTAVLTYA